jgi:hypothetical protein
MESKRSRRSRDKRVGDEAVATKWAPSPSWIACPACQLLYMALHEGGGGRTLPQTSGVLNHGARFADRGYFLGHYISHS